MATVKEFIGVVKTGVTKTGKPYAISKIIADDKEAETFDTVTIGDTGELTYNPKFSKWNFNKTKNNDTESKPAPVKKFEADPVKLKQEFTLEVAKNQSIQRQVAVKAVVDLMVAADIQMVSTTAEQIFNDWFDITMNKLANHWVYTPKEEIEDILPTDEEVMLEVPFE